MLDLSPSVHPITSLSASFFKFQFAHSLKPIFYCIPRCGDISNLFPMWSRRRRLKDTIHFVSLQVLYSLLGIYIDFGVQCFWKTSQLQLTLPFQHYHCYRQNAWLFDRNKTMYCIRIYDIYWVMWIHCMCLHGFINLIFQ